MRLRTLLIWPFFGLTGLLAARSPAASLSRTPTLAATALPTQRFRFDAGAPLLAPAGVAPDGMLCVGTVDGYVHALDADGGYRWSHSVQGAVTRRPLFAAQHWYVATSAVRIYALGRDGVLHWVFKPPSPPDSELAADENGTLYFVAADHFLYGVSARGGVQLRVALGELKLGPNSDSNGTIWAENRAGTVLRVRGQVVRRFEPGEPLDFTFPDPELLRDPSGAQWRGRNDGVLELSVAGTLSTSLLPLCGAPLLAPAWSAAAHYAVLSSRNGLVFALDPQAARESR